MTTPSKSMDPPTQPKYAINDIVHILRPLSSTAAAGFGTAYPTNLELIPNTIWSIQDVKPSATKPGGFEYTATPLTMTEFKVDEAQIVLAQMPIDAEVVMVSEEKQKGGMRGGFVYKVREVRVVWDRNGQGAKQGGYCVMVRMLDELGQLRDCKAEELRLLTEEEKAEGRGFFPIDGFGQER